MNVHLFLVQKINQVKKINRGGWTGFGTATVGIDPNTFEVLNGHPTKIPTDEILGGVVQNCRGKKNGVSENCVIYLSVVSVYLVRDGGFTSRREGQMESP